MSGGVAYVYDPGETFRSRCNRDMVELEPLVASGVETELESEDANVVLALLRNHLRFTGSTVAGALLADWDAAKQRFVKVIPRDYKRVMLAEARARSESREPAFTELVGAVANG